MAPRNRRHSHDGVNKNNMLQLAHNLQHAMMMLPQQEEDSTVSPSASDCSSASIDSDISVGSSSSSNNNNNNSLGSSSSSAQAEAASSSSWRQRVAEQDGDSLRCGHDELLEEEDDEEVDRSRAGAAAELMRSFSCNSGRSLSCAQQQQQQQAATTSVDASDDSVDRCRHRKPDLESSLHENSGSRCVRTATTAARAANKIVWFVGHCYFEFVCFFAMCRAGGVGSCIHDFLEN